MKKFWILPLLFFLHCCAARAQVYDVACPAGTTVLNQALNPQNGHYKAYLCIDFQGNVTTPGTTPSGSSGSALVNVKNFGAIGDAAWSANCSTSGGSTTITNPDNPWLLTDAGKFIQVMNVATVPPVYAPTTKIVSVNSAGNITVSSTPTGSAGSAQKCVWFTQDDTSSFTAAKTFANAKRTSLITNGPSPALSQGGGVFCPPGGYAVSGTVFYDSYSAGPSYGMAFIGANSGNCVLYPLSNFVGTIDSVCGGGGHVGLIFVCQISSGSDVENIYEEGSSAIFNNTTSITNNNSMNRWSHCTQCVIRNNKSYNYALVATNSGMLYVDSFSGIIENNSLQGNQGGLGGANNAACVLSGASSTVFNNNLCSNAPANSLIISQSGTRLSSGGQLVILNELTDECAGLSGAVPCTAISLNSVVNYYGGVSFGGLPQLISVDATSQVYFHDHNVQQFGSSASNIPGITIASGGFVYGESTLFGSNGTAVAISGPSGATFVDGGGNTFQNCLSGACAKITPANFTTQAFSGGIVPQSTSTHSQNVCPAVQGNLLATAQNLCQVILDRNYQLLTIGAVSGGTTPASSACATPPVITLSDGTRSATMTMTTAKTSWSSAIDAVTNINQVFASGATLTVSIGANTCATPPSNVSVSYILQSVLNF